MDPQSFKKKSRPFNVNYYDEDEATNFTSQESDKSKLTPSCKQGWETIFSI